MDKIGQIRRDVQSPTFTENRLTRNEIFDKVENEFDPREEIADTFAISEYTLLNNEEDADLSNTKLELDLMIEQMIEKQKGLWQCKVCGKTSKDKTIVNLNQFIFTVFL